MYQLYLNFFKVIVLKKEKKNLPEEEDTSPALSEGPALTLASSR